MAGEPSNDVNRRTVLKGIGGVGFLTTAAGVASAGATSPGRVSLLEEAVSPGQIRSEVERSAAPLLEQLANEGVIDESRVDELDLTPRPLSAVAGDGSGATAITFDRPKSGVARRLFVSTNVPEGTVNVFVDRDEKTAYAAVITEEQTVIHHADDRNRMEPLTHCDDICLSEVCDYSHGTPICLKEYRESDPYGDCYVETLSCSCKCM